MGRRGEPRVADGWRAVGVECRCCPGWRGDDRRVGGRAAELGDEGFEEASQPGRSGQLGGISDGELVFSKHEVHRFPEPGELLALLQR